MSNTNTSVEEEAEASFSPGEFLSGRFPGDDHRELDEIDAYGEGYLDAYGVLKFR